MKFLGNSISIALLLLLLVVVMFTVIFFFFVRVPLLLVLFAFTHLNDSNSFSFLLTSRSLRLALFYFCFHVLQFRESADFHTPQRMIALTWHLTALLELTELLFHYIEYVCLWVCVLHFNIKLMKMMKKKTIKNY